MSTMEQEIAELWRSLDRMQEELDNLKGKKKPTEWKESIHGIILTAKLAACNTTLEIKFGNSSTFCLSEKASREIAAWFSMLADALEDRQ